MLRSDEDDSIDEETDCVTCIAKSREGCLMTASGNTAILTKEKRREDSRNAQKLRLSQMLNLEQEEPVEVSTEMVVGRRNTDKTI